jgi:hypothetical protein
MSSRKLSASTSPIRSMASVPCIEHRVRQRQLYESAPTRSHCAHVRSVAERPAEFSNLCVSLDVRPPACSALVQPICLGSGSSAWRCTCTCGHGPTCARGRASNPSSAARFCRPGPDAYPADSCRPITLSPPTHDREGAALANAPKRGKQWVKPNGAAAVLVNRNAHAL